VALGSRASPDHHAAFLYYAPTMDPPRERFRSLLLVFAIALLFASELERLDLTWRQPLFFAHLGAFLLWQPVVAADRRMGLRETILVAGGALAVTLLLNPWVMLFWSAFVTALVGGRVFDFSHRNERWLHLGALGFLMAFLFTLVLPDLLPETIRQEMTGASMRAWMEMALAACLVLLFAEATRLARTRHETALFPGMYDPVHSIWLLLLLLVVSFSGIVLMTLGARGYLASIGIALVSVGALLITANMMLRRTDDGEHRDGLMMLFSRYLLSYVIPYDQWLERLARLSRDENDADRFFADAMRAVGELIPMLGASWQGAIPAGKVGESVGAHRELFEFQMPDDPGAVIEVQMLTGRAMSVAMAWHVRLLVQVALQFYAAKSREARLGSRQYMRAVHETGARLTHDVKNLLQSLDGLIAAAASLPEDRQVRQLVSRQLPEISRRLSQTLAKLQQPVIDQGEAMDWRNWWDSMRVQYEPQGVRFKSTGTRTLDIPADAFASALDNFLQNALQKRKSWPGLAVLAEITVQDSVVTLAVEDDGDPVDPEVLRSLLEHPVASHNGLGIGLYQAAQLALTRGMKVQLACNEPGRVRFEARYEAA
jgi:signal transduction histidine kinase